MDKSVFGHLIKAELEEGKVLVQSNMSLQTISAGEAVEGKLFFKEGHRDFSPKVEISRYHQSKH